MENTAKFSRNLKLYPKPASASDIAHCIERVLTDPQIRGESSENAADDYGLSPT
jgi:hypothetical protein